jgi:hypothetical protein
VAIAIAVLAVTLLGRHHATATPAARGLSSLTQLERNPEVEQLLDHFAILRRPQTVADRSWPAGQRPTVATQQVIPTFTRLATTIDGQRIFLFVDGPDRRTPPGRSPDHRYTMFVALIEAHNYFAADAPYSANLGDYTIIPVPFGSLPGSGGRSGQSVSISIVPDGIAKVRWAYRCSPSRVSACNGRRTETIYPPLQGNIAIAKTPRLGPVPAVTWYSSGGKAVVIYRQHEPGKRNPKPFPGVRP